MCIEEGLLQAPDGNYIELDIEDAKEQSGRQAQILFTAMLCYASSSTSE